VLHKYRLYINTGAQNLGEYDRNEQHELVEWIHSSEFYKIDSAKVNPLEMSKYNIILAKQMSRL